VRWLALVVLGGCGLGIGGGYVGQWRPRDQVDFEACLLDQAGGCADTKQVVSHIPGRRFWGALLELPALGAAQVDHGGERSTQLHAQAGLEVLRGSGRWALGVRAGMVNNARTGEGRGGMPLAGAATLFPIDVIGHLGVIDQLSVYGGAGVIPLSFSDGAHTLLGGRVLAGLQLPLNKVQGAMPLVLSLELDREYLHLDRPYRATGVAGCLGVHF